MFGAIALWRHNHIGLVVSVCGPLLVTYVLTLVLMPRNVLERLVDCLCELLRSARDGVHAVWLAIVGAARTAWRECRWGQHEACAPVSQSPSVCKPPLPTPTCGAVVVGGEAPWDDDDDDEEDYAARYDPWTIKDMQRNLEEWVCVACPEVGRFKSRKDAIRVCRSIGLPPPQ